MAVWIACIPIIGGGVQLRNCVRFRYRRRRTSSLGEIQAMPSVSIRSMVFCLVRT